MGTNSAPELATLCIPMNLLILMKYVKRTLLKLEVFIFRSASSMTFCLLTMLTLTRLQHALKGIYPRALYCGQTHKSTSNVQVCGLDISNRGASFDIAVYDKKSVFPFHIIDFPHSDSAITLSILYSVGTGQLHRFDRLSNTGCLNEMCFCSLL